MNLINKWKEKDNLVDRTVPWGSRLGERTARLRSVELFFTVTFDSWYTLGCDRSGTDTVTAWPAREVVSCA